MRNYNEATDKASLYAHVSKNTEITHAQYTDALKVIEQYHCPLYMAATIVDEAIGRAIEDWCFEHGVNEATCPDAEDLFWNIDNWKFKED